LSLREVSSAPNPNGQCRVNGTGFGREFVEEFVEEVDIVDIAR